MGKYLDFYKKCMETKKIPGYGLCNCKGLMRDLKRFTPTNSNRVELWGRKRSTVFWAHGGAWWVSSYKLAYEFTTLRQNIVLLLAAMNDEL